MVAVIRVEGGDTDIDLVDCGELEGVCRDDGSGG